MWKIIQFGVRTGTALCGATSHHAIVDYFLITARPLTHILYTNYSFISQ